MMVSLNTQALILLYSFFSGIIFGISFDIYRSVFFKFKEGIVKFIRDILFWIFIGVFVFYFLLYTQYAIFTFYTYFYIFLGILFYFKFVSWFLFLKINAIILGIFYFFRIVFRNISYVFYKMFKN